MPIRKAPPPALDKGERAHLAVTVEEIRPEICDYCAGLAGRRVTATHAVVVTGWVGAYGSRGRLLAGKLHAEQARAGLIAELSSRPGFAFRGPSTPEET